MDLDSFAALHAQQWQRLESLSKMRRLSGAQADELVHLYQQVATQLSQLRSAAPDPALISRLSVILERARTRVSGAMEPSWRDLARFFTAVVPAALYRTRWWSVGAALGFLLVAVGCGVWATVHPELQGAVGTPNELRRLVDQEFASYYSEHPHSSFAFGVWTNNAWLAAQCIALGITGIWPVVMLVQNAVNIGLTGAVMVHYGAADVFFGLIAPHGLLEISCLTVAGGVGIRLFWAWVVPGPRTRGRAIAEEGRTTLTAAVGLAVALAVAGMIEGFVTPSGFPSGVKIAIGLVAGLALWLVIFVVGRRAVARGEHADLQAGTGVTPVAVGG